MDEPIRKILLRDKYTSLTEFIETHLHDHNASRCQASWNTSTLTVSCKECQESDRMCYCLDCFINGNHEGHHTFLEVVDSGNCDCGDPELCKECGFCSNHSNSVTQVLDEETRKAITLISDLAFTRLDETNFSEILEILSTFVSLGNTFSKFCN